MEAQSMTWRKGVSSCPCSETCSRMDTLYRRGHADMLARVARCQAASLVSSPHPLLSGHPPVQA